MHFHNISSSTIILVSFNFHSYTLVLRNILCSSQRTISAIHCVNSVNETINYYINNSGKVYVCTLDASKAFDRVNIFTIFKKLFERNVYPYS